MILPGHVRRRLTGLELSPEEWPLAVELAKSYKTAQLLLHKGSLIQVFRLVFHTDKRYSQALKRYRKALRKLSLGESELLRPLRYWHKKSH